jgi:hypothetical protein
MMVSKTTAVPLLIGRPIGVMPKLLEGLGFQPVGDGLSAKYDIEPEDYILPYQVSPYITE